MNIKKRFKLKPIIVGSWVTVEPYFCHKCGDEVRIKDVVYRVVRTRQCGIKLAPRI